MPVRPDPDVLQEWVRCGVPAGEVGARLGLSRATGYSWLRRYGVSADAPVFSQEHLVTQWRAGQAVGQIAADTGLEPDVVRERLVTAAVLQPSRSYFRVGAKDDPLPEYLLRDWYVREGFTVDQVAALTGTTARQVRYRLGRYRMSAGRPGPAPRLRRRLTEDVLTGLYVHEGLSCATIAERAGASAESVRELLVEYGIARRSNGTRSRTPAPRSGRRARRFDSYRQTRERAEAAKVAATGLVEQLRTTVQAAEEICRGLELRA